MYIHQCAQQDVMMIRDTLLIVLTPARDRNGKPEERWASRAAGLVVDSPVLRLATGRKKKLE